MAEKQQTTLATRTPDPFALLRRMTSELDRMMDEWPSLRWPSSGTRSFEGSSWSPKIEVVENPRAPGQYQAVAFLRPHFQLDAVDFSLRLVADVPDK